MRRSKKSSIYGLSSCCWVLEVGWNYFTMNLKLHIHWMRSSLLNISCRLQVSKSRASPSVAWEGLVQLRMLSYWHAVTAIHVKGCIWKIFNSRRCLELRSRTAGKLTGEARVWFIRRLAFHLVTLSSDTLLSQTQLARCHTSMLSFKQRSCIWAHFWCHLLMVWMIKDAV